MPMAASRLMAPVGIALTLIIGPFTPMRMMEPLPYAFSMVPMATFRAFLRSSEAASALVLIIGAESLVGGGVLWALDTPDATCGSRRTPESLHPCGAAHKGFMRGAENFHRLSRGAPGPPR